MQLSMLDIKLTQKPSKRNVLYTCFAMISQPTIESCRSFHKRKKEKDSQSEFLQTKQVAEI